MERQYQTEAINELASALSKAQGEMTHAAKAVDNTFFKSKYADLPAVIDAARPALAKHGLSVVQFTEIDDNGNITLVTQLTHASGQWMRSWYPVNPVKNDPQGLGSAVTYSRRYSYMSMVGIAASADDDDGNAASGNGHASIQASPVANATPKEARETAKARNDRWKAIETALLEAKTLDDLKVVWAGNYTHIQAFAAQDQEYADGLERAKEKRKVELKEVDAMKAGMPQGFNDITDKE